MELNMLFWPAFTEFDRSRHLKTAAILIARSNRELVELPMVLRFFRNYNFFRFSQTISIIKRNALFIFEVLEIFF